MAKKRLILGCVLAFCLPPSARAETLTYSNGTGFFINHYGYLLTSNHVVDHCGQISIAGAVDPADAKLVAADTGNDLALLKTSAIVSDVANLATAKQPLRAGDPMVVVGFPGQSWGALHVVTKQSQIIDTRGPRGEEKWLEFDDALAKGNSGGPLLDVSANVVGVVAAKGELYTYNSDGARDELVQKFDIAVSLPVVRKFLDDHDVRYQEADSGLYLSADHVTDIARRFVVNVRCKVER